MNIDWGCDGDHALVVFKFISQGGSSQYLFYPESAGLIDSLKKIYHRGAGAQYQRVSPQVPHATP